MSAEGKQFCVFIIEKAGDRFMEAPDSCTERMALSISPLSLGLLICFVCLHCCWCLTPPSCSYTAPTKCLFSNSFCDWESKGWQKSVSEITAITSNNPDHKATVRSLWACSTQNTPRCLHFQFLLDDRHPQSTLDVVLEENNGKRHVWRMKSSQSSREWTTGSVTIRTTSDFRVYFVGAWMTGQSPVISLRNFEMGNIPCVMSPIQAYSVVLDGNISAWKAPKTSNCDTISAEEYDEACMLKRIIEILKESIL